MPLNIICIDEPKQKSIALPENFQPDDTFGPTQIEIKLKPFPEFTQLLLCYMEATITGTPP